MTDWNKLKVAELKDELKTRGIPLTGLKLKADFVAKLEELETTPPIPTEEHKSAEITTPTDDTAAKPDEPNAEERDSLTITKNSIPEENLHNGEAKTQMIDEESHVLPADIVLPEMVDMYSSSQIKPTPSQPLTEILAAKDEMKVTPSITKTPPPLRIDNTSDASSPVPTSELIEDSKKRKRRSVTPPPSTQDIALKKAKAGDGTPVVTKQQSSLEQIQAATDAAEAIQAPDGLGDNVAIKEDVSGLRGNAERKPSQFDIATGNDQAALRNSSPKQTHSSRVQDDRDLAPALYPASKSLYLCNFKRPLQIPTLRKHLAQMAQPSSIESVDDPVIRFHLDNIRTHALVSFDSVAAAARVRSAVHETIFPDEASRMPIWVDFVPDDMIEGWIAREASSNDRNKKWEVVYKEGPDGMEVIHQEVDATGPPIKPGGVKPRRSSIPETLSRPAAPKVPGVHPDREALVPRREEESLGRQIPSRSDAKISSPDNNTGTGFRALDELFSSTTTKPKLYYKSVSTSIAEDRLEHIKDLRIGHDDMGRSGDEGMKRYSFEVYKGREDWVDKGPEFGYGRRGVEALEGRRGRGGYRGGRGDRGRGGDSWRGRY